MVTLTKPRSGHEDSDPLVAHDDLSDNTHRQVIGAIGALLPFIIVGLNGLWPTTDVKPWPPMESISAYYYTAAVVAFVGMLVTLSLFLLTYKGYNNKHNKADRRASNIAGIAALGVALFPTNPPYEPLRLSWWAEWMKWGHYASAAVLFTMFAYFCFKLFRLKEEDEPLSPEKRFQNRVYTICGYVIVAAIAWIGWCARTERPIFVPESVALGAFATSWLVKGKTLRTMKRAVARRTQSSLVHTASR